MGYRSEGQSRDRFSCLPDRLKFPERRIMKFKRELVDEMAAWVAENGLIEYGGAPLRTFCEHFSITEPTYYNWCENLNFFNAIKNARERWKSGLEQRLVLSMAVSAAGYDTTEVQVEKVPSSNPRWKGKMVIKRRTETTRHVPPNTAAGIFLLTNLCPERWRNTQRLEHTGKDGEELKLRPLTMEEIEFLKQNVEK